MQVNNNNINDRPCDLIGNRRSNSRVYYVKWATGYDRVDYRGLHRKYATGRKHKYNPTMLKICSWNVRDLNRPRKLAIVENNVSDISITGLSETHWKESGHFTTSNGNQIIR